MELFTVELSRVETGGISRTETGFFTLQGVGLDPAARAVKSALWLGHLCGLGTCVT